MESSVEDLLIRIVIVPVAILGYFDGILWSVIPHVDDLLMLDL